MPAAPPIPIYLDHNATTPMLPDVVEQMRTCFTTLAGNPASQHEFGRRARRRLEDVRQRIGELVGAKMTGRDADSIVFTSGGTEANNLAVRGLVGPFSAGRLVISSLEHPSVSAGVGQLAHSGWHVDRLGVDGRGVLQVRELPSMLRPETQLVCALLGHNETGVLQPVTEIAALCAERGVRLHTDAAQVVGKIPVDFRALGVATMSFAAHKFHGPVGIGALVVRHGVTLTPQLFGGFQQAGLRPGTESVVLAVGMLTALELWHREQEARQVRLHTLREDFERAICTGWPRAMVIGADAPRLPHTSNIALVGFDRQALFIALDQAGIACSTGSACASGSSEPSPALVAMGLDEAVISSALRFSFGATTTAAEVAESSRRILQVCKNLRR